VLAAAAAILLAGVIYITTDKGRIEIRTDVDDVDVVMSRGGNEVKTIDLATGSQVTWMPSGNYTISLKQDRNDVQIAPNGFTLSRWGKLKEAKEFLAVMDAGKFGQLFDMCSSWAKQFATRGSS
jgi:hypothetical protein